MHDRFVKLPSYGAGQRIGIFGGSFDPAHAGHVHVAMTALQKLQLNWLWVLISPGNPLKTEKPRNVAERMQKLRGLLPDPRILVLDLESQAGTQYSLDTVRFLKKRAPDARFVWVMGADNLKTFHRWKGWQEIAQLLPICIVDRSDGKFSAENSQAGQYLEPWRQRADAASRLALRAPPAWTFLHGPHILLSSSLLRQARTY